MVKEKGKEMEKEIAELVLKAGHCDLAISHDEKGRPILEPHCPVDEHGIPELSDELKALNDALRSEEIVLRPAKVKESEDK